MRNPKSDDLDPCDTNAPEDPHAELIPREEPEVITFTREWSAFESVQYLAAVYATDVAKLLFQALSSARFNLCISTQMRMAQEGFLFSMCRDADALRALFVDELRET